MPVNRVKEMPKSLFPGAKRSLLMQVPEYDYAMSMLRKGLYDGEVLEIIVDPRDLERFGGGTKHPHSAFVHLISGAIRAENLNYIVRQRSIDGKDKLPRIYIMASPPDKEEVVADNKSKKE